MPLRFQMISVHKNQINSKEDLSLKLVIPLNIHPLSLALIPQGHGEPGANVEFEKPVDLMNVFGLWEETRHPEETHTGLGRIC